MDVDLCLLLGMMTPVVVVVVVSLVELVEGRWRLRHRGPWRMVVGMVTAGGGMIIGEGALEGLNMAEVVVVEEEEEEGMVVQLRLGMVAVVKSTRRVKQICEQANQNQT
jgi:hypothetical protein